MTNIDYLMYVNDNNDPFLNINRLFGRGGLGYKPEINGGSLSSKDLENMLSGSYDKNLDDKDNFIIDKNLSGKRVKVYHNPDTGQTVVSHRGTANLKDWGTDIGMALGYEGGNRFKQSKKVQRKAENKYGTENLTTIGHSLGARMAEKYGQRGDEVITLNKPIIPRTFGNKISKNQYDIRTENDPVSALHLLQKNKKMKTIKSTSYNPLTEHSVNVLNRTNEIYGGLGYNPYGQMRGIGFNIEKIPQYDEQGEQITDKSGKPKFKKTFVIDDSGIFIDDLDKKGTQLTFKNLKNIRDSMQYPNDLSYNVTYEEPDVNDIESLKKFKERYPNEFLFYEMNKLDEYINKRMPTEINKLKYQKNKVDEWIKNPLSYIKNMKKYKETIGEYKQSKKSDRIIDKDLNDKLIMLDDPTYVNEHTDLINRIITISQNKGMAYGKAFEFFMTSPDMNDKKLRDKIVDDLMEKTDDDKLNNLLLNVVDNNDRFNDKYFVYDLSVIDNNNVDKGIIELKNYIETKSTKQPSLRNTINDYIENYAKYKNGLINKKNNATTLKYKTKILNKLTKARLIFDTTMNNHGIDLTDNKISGAYGKTVPKYDINRKIQGINKFDYFQNKIYDNRFENIKDVEARLLMVLDDSLIKYNISSDLNNRLVNNQIVQSNEPDKKIIGPKEREHVEGSYFMESSYPKFSKDYFGNPIQHRRIPPHKISLLK